MEGAVCEGEVWKAIDARATSFPSELFASLDREMTEYARAADAGQIGPVIPPVLSIVLDRAASRDRICAVLQDLRDEWADARAKVWAIVDAMKEAATLQELNDLRRHLQEAARYFSPKPAPDGPRPVRVLWNVLGDAAAGAVTTSVAGGKPAVGAVIGGVRAGVAAVTRALPDSLDALLRRGAFDLAARARRGVMDTEPMPALLSRFLTTAEKQKLGL